MFYNQDAWREMELCYQRSPFRLAGDRDLIIAGLGIPFKRLNFGAMAQLRSVTNVLLH